MTTRASLDKLTVVGLKALAKKEGINLVGVTLKKDIVSTILTAGSKVISEESAGCSFSSIEHLVNLSEHLTILNVYISCKKSGLSILSGMKLWLELKTERIDKISNEFQTDEKYFLIAADVSLTQACQTKRKYVSDQHNFVQSLLEGGCNCSCGSQMLLALKEAYDLKHIGAAAYTGHINIIYRNRNNIMVYETTNQIYRWEVFEDDEDNLESLFFSPSSMMIFPIWDHLLHLKTNPERTSFIKDLFLDSPRHFWKEIPIFQNIWDLYRLPENERLSIEKQLPIIDKIRDLAASETDAFELSQIFFVLRWIDVFIVEVIDFTFSLFMEFLKVVNENKNMTFAEKIQSFKKTGRINIYNTLLLNFTYNRYRMPLAMKLYK